jgi:hypothetical protein
MQFSRTMRGFRACILGLFVVAQVAGVIPLIYDHTLNIYETAPVAAHKHPLANATVANPDADHHHGLLDLHGRASSTRPRCHAGSLRERAHRYHRSDRARRRKA